MATTFKVPVKLAAAADLLYEVRQKRYALQKEVDALQAQETAICEALIDKLPKSDATGIAGKVARVYVESKEVVSITDWDAYYAYVLGAAKKNPGAWALLQRRVGEGAVKEIWAAGKTIPGATKLQVPVVRMNKL